MAVQWTWLTMRGSMISRAHPGLRFLGDLGCGTYTHIHKLTHTYIHLCGNITFQEDGPNFTFFNSQLHDK